jgi:ketosteroid isomerase-like protein
MLKFMLLTGCVGLMALTVACSKDTSVADAQAIKDKEVAWSKDCATKDPAQWASNYADDATFMMPNEPILHGAGNVKSAMGAVMQDQNFALTFQGDKVEVSGDLAYTQGTYSMTTTDQKGNPATDKGKYLTVWKKQADGSWKVIEDMSNSDLPAGGN